jgi:hypothetical protein
MDILHKPNGACRGGNSPENNAGRSVYGDCNFQERFHNSETCTGLVLALNDDNWCTARSLLKLTGDGRA